MIAALKRDSIRDGVHIMAIGREEAVPDILAAAGLAAVSQLRRQVRDTRIDKGGKTSKALPPVAVFGFLSSLDSQ